MQELLWVEKYRPRVLDDMALPKRIKDKFKDGLYQNVLLTGTQGNGKTTLAGVLSAGRSTKFLNASLESGIDEIRNGVMNFGSTNSLRGGKKVIILDEIDNMSQAAQKGLRGTIEKLQPNVDFIATCNYPENLLEPVVGRFEEISFNFTEDEILEHKAEVAKRILYVIQNEGLDISRDAMLFMINTMYPDMRSMIIAIQGVARDGVKKIEVSDLKKSHTNKGNLALYEIILNEFDPIKLYQYTRENWANKEHQAYESLGEPFLEYLLDKPKSNKIPLVAKTVHKYAYESQSAIDKLISLHACIFELSQIFK